MVDTTIVKLYGDFYGVRDLYNAWNAAGRPPINSAGRLYWQQKYYWDLYQAGQGNPADNPDQPTRYRLPHVRFMALDIDPTPERIRALTAAGLYRPLSYEPWHWELRNINSYPLVYSIPLAATLDATPVELQKESDMAYPIEVNKTHRFMVAPGYVAHYADAAASNLSRNILTADDKWIALDGDQFLKQLDAFGVPRYVVDINVGTVLDPFTGAQARGAVWSWAKEASAKADRSNKTLDEIVKKINSQPTTPPKA